MANSVTFKNGCQMPIIGLGTWQTTDEVQLENALDAALEAGYRHIDTAYLYQNEHLIGKVLKKWFDSGKLKREDLFIVTKLPGIGMSKDKVAHFVQLSLDALQLSYVDLYLIHFPCGFKYVDDKTLIPYGEDGNMAADLTTNLEEIWKAMEAQVDAGKIRSIGVSNFNESQIERIVKIAKHHPMNIQVELHAYFQQKSLREACKKHGITVCAYGPVGSPGRKALYELRGLKFESNGLLEDPNVKAIAEKKGKSTAQILLRFLTQEGIVVIPKSVNASRIKENFNIFDIELTPEELDTLRNLDQGSAGRSFDFSSFRGIQSHPEFPFPELRK